MLLQYSSQIEPLEHYSHGLFVGVPLLALANVSLTVMALMSASLTLPKIFLLALFPGSIMSLWQLQILHDSLHSSLLPKSNTSIKTSSLKKAGPTLVSRILSRIIRHRSKIQKFILFFGSFPNAYGYYLYLKFGHLTHHKTLGDPTKVSVAKLFNSKQIDFEDGDLLFAVHRMKLLGDIGPKIKFPWSQKEDESLTLSIGSKGFSLWKNGNSIRNALIFSFTFLFERLMLVMNDFVVALTGRNYFFPFKPKRFHRQGTTYARWAVMIRLGLCFLVKSWKPLCFLYLSETLWSIPPHPACAMFITNHGSKQNPENGLCIPSSSTYAGRWYSLLTLGTNYHVEHHDFPNIPLHKLGKLRQIAPEYYQGKSNDNLFKIMRSTFAMPQYYACMNAGSVVDG